MIAVAASGYGTSVATFTAYRAVLRDGRRCSVRGRPTSDATASRRRGAKREGDGRTPSGVFGFDFMFGVYPDPGVHFPFRRITGPNIVWDDDPASANYNEWIDTNTASAGTSPEPMDVSAYDAAAAVIAYNDARSPGLRSAIFLHVSSGRSTAGCVALPYDELLEVLRWLDPAQGPRIAIGTPSALTS